MRNVKLVSKLAIFIMATFFFVGVGESESPASLVGTYRLVSFETRYEKEDIQFNMGNFSLIVYSPHPRLFSYSR